MSTVLIASAALLGGVAFTASAAATSPTSDAEAAGQACELVDTDWTASSRVEPHRTELFGDYSNSGVAWTGGDSTYSVKLPSGRTVWLFSDTFLGPVNDDLSRPIETPFLNNSFVVERGDELTTVTGGTSDEPDSLVPPDRERSWNWLGAGMASPRSLDVMFMEFAAFGDGQWDWAWEQNKLVRFDPKTYEVREVVPMPSESGVQWASWLERNDGYTYIYGVDDQGLNKYMHLARVAGKNLTTSWEYWTGTGWSSTETDSAAIMPGVANEYSVSKFRVGYLLVTQDTTEVFSRNIVAYPPGQAHFVEEAEPAVNGGAVKSPPQFPYLIDWACSSAGSWASLVIESIFGVSVSLDGAVTADPIVAGLDPDARLTGLVVDGTSYDIAADGTVIALSPAGSPGVG